MRLVVLIFLLLTGCTSNTPTTTVEPPTVQRQELQIAKVVGIVDGDTIDVLIDGNQQQRLRLNGIDAPERGQPFGNNAKQFLSKQLMGKQIEYASLDTDRYERVIAEIYVNDQRIGLSLVEAGLAWHYEKYSDDEELAAAQSKAKELKLGLWSDPRFIAPWDWRKLSKEERDELR